MQVPYSFLNEDDEASHVAPRCFAGESDWWAKKGTVVFTLDRMRRAGLLADTLHLSITLQVTCAGFHAPAAVAMLPAQYVSARMGIVLTSGTKSDVTLLVDDGEFAAHWNVLSRRSFFFSKC